MFGSKRRKAPAVNKAYPLLTYDDLIVDVMNNAIGITVKGNRSLLDGDQITVNIEFDTPKLINGRLYGADKEFKPAG